MTPIDDELRSALSSRADSVDLSPDFFAGVERRATRMRRNRVAASVAGTALAVAAVAVAVPVLSSSTATVQPAPPATAPPTEAPSPAADPFVLDPAAPWEYRGDPQVLEDGLQTFAREWGVRHGVDEADVRFTPLYGELYEPSAQATVVFLAQGAEDGPRWGVAETGEAGPEFLVDTALGAGTTALAATLPGDEVARLLVVASSEVGQIEYRPAASAEWVPMESIASGVAITPLEGDPATDRIRVLDGDGDLDDPVFEGPAPDAVGAPSAPPGEGPGTDGSPDVETAAYAFDVAAPWAYRGPAELTQHPDLGAEDLRLFDAAGAGRDDGSWSDRPLLGVELADGLSVLMVLHSRGDQVVVSTTSQRQDEAPVQSEQSVVDGQLLLQSFVPDSDGGGVLVALASPRAGAVETEVPGARALDAVAGVGLWDLPPGAGAGGVFLYSEGDGVLYHSEPARRS